MEGSRCNKKSSYRKSLVLGKHNCLRSLLQRYMRHRHMFRHASRINIFKDQSNNAFSFVHHFSSYPITFCIFSRKNREKFWKQWVSSWEKSLRTEMQNMTEIKDQYKDYTRFGSLWLLKKSPLLLDFIVLPLSNLAKAQECDMNCRKHSNCLFFYNLKKELIHPLTKSLSSSSPVLGATEHRSKWFRYNAFPL